MMTKSKYKNNPFNIRFSPSDHWLGLDGDDNGFCTFSDLSYGIRAWFLIIKRYREYWHHNTIMSIVHRFAPETENDTESYIKYCCKFCQRDCDELLSDSDLPSLALAMASFEGNPLSIDDVYECLVKFIK